MSDEQLFALFFASLAGIQAHPRNEGAVIDFSYWAEMAKLMVAITREYYPEV